MSAYPLLLTAHLFAAVVFAGTVCFEVLVLEPVRQRVPAAAMRLLDGAIGARASRLMPWVLAVLYASGLGLAWHYRAALADPSDSRFGLLLAAKIGLATSVFVHFLTAMALRRRGRLAGRASRRLHLSVFAHVAGIVLAAKAMFHLTG